MNNLRIVDVARLVRKLCYMFLFSISFVVGRDRAQNAKGIKMQMNN